jgi:hypothetical protein
MSKTLSAPAALKHPLLRDIKRLNIAHLRAVIDAHFADRIVRVGPYRAIPESLLPEIAAACQDYVKQLTNTGRQPVPA